MNRMMVESDVHLPDNLILFREVQRMRQPAMWAFVLVCSGVVAGILGYGVARQMVLGHPWGDRPMPNPDLLVTACVGWGLAIALPLAFRQMRLVVKVNRGRLHIRYLPFLSRTIALDRISSWEARVVNPLQEYGGWGIRWGGKDRGWAYNVSGNLGVQLVLQDGQRILIGSRHADDLVRALERARET